jgi:hypothetical protein
MLLSGMEAPATTAGAAVDVGDATVWLIRAGSGGRFASEFVGQGIAAIGWPEVGDLSGRDRADLTTAVSEAYEDTSAGTVAGQLYRFANELAVGDLVVTPDSQTRELHVGRVTGAYEFRDHAPIEGHPNTVRVEWIDQFSRDELPRRVLYKLGALMTVSTPSAQEHLRTLLLDPSARQGGPVAASSETDDETPVEDLYVGGPARRRDPRRHPRTAPGAGHERPRRLLPHGRPDRGVRAPIGRGIRGWPVAEAPPLPTSRPAAGAAAPGLPQGQGRWPPCPPFCVSSILLARGSAAVTPTHAAGQREQPEQDE